MNLRFNKYELGFLILFMFLFPQSILSQISDIFSYSDEIFAVLGGCAFFNRYSRKIIWRIYPHVKKIMTFAFIIALIGWISSYLHKIQPSLGVNLFDCFTFLKFFFIFFLSLLLLRKSRLDKVIIPIYQLTTFYLITGFIFLVISQVIDIGMTFEKRYGFNSFMFINSNPGDYASILIISLVIVHIYSSYKKKSCRFVKLITIILIIFTFRGKSLGFIATYLMVVFFIERYNNLSVKSLVILAILGIVGGYVQIRYYFVDNITPRALLLSNGIVTANDHFPLGAGYSTYGSNMAKIHYSPLYTQYGFKNIWGMNEEEEMFLNDNFWPMIMGQYGWIGLILFILILLVLFKIVSDNIVQKQLKIAGFSIFFLLLYSSIGGPIFVHYIGCASIIIFSLIMRASKTISLKNTSYV